MGAGRTLVMTFPGQDNGREDDSECQLLALRKVSCKEEFLAAFGRMNRSWSRTGMLQACFLKLETQAVSFGSSFGRERVRTSHNVVTGTGLQVHVASGGQA